MRLIWPMTMGAMWLGACGAAPMVRETSFRTTERFVGVSGLDDRAVTSDVFWFAPDGGKQAGVELDGEQVFQVPPGPALFQLSPGEFLYSEGSHFELCRRQLKGARDAGISYDVSLAEAARAGDTLRVGTASGDLRLVELDAGTLAAQGRASAYLDPLLVGDTTVLHLTTETLPGTFSRTFAVGLLDAGALLQRPGETVELMGRLTPLTRGSEVQVAWSDASLSPLAERRSTTFSAIHKGLTIATLTGEAGQGMAPLALPALQPDRFRVAGSVLLLRAASFAEYGFFEWSGPWSASPEMRLALSPPLEVRFSADGRTLSWTAPDARPSWYQVVLKRRDAAPTLMGIYLTDETSIPLPPDQHANLMTGEVYAMHGKPFLAGCDATDAELTATLPAPTAFWPQ